MKMKHCKPQKKFLIGIILAGFLLLSCSLFSQAGPTEQADTPTPTEAPAPDDYKLDITLRVLEGDDMKERTSFTYTLDFIVPLEGSELVINDSVGEFTGKYSYNQGFSCVGSSSVGGTFDFTVSGQSMQKALSDLNPKIANVINVATADSPGIITDGQVSMFMFTFSDPSFEYTKEPEGMCLPQPFQVQTDLNAKVLPMIWYAMHADAEVNRSIPAVPADFCFEPRLMTDPDDPNYSSSFFRTYYEICYNLTKK